MGWEAAVMNFLGGEPIICVSVYGWCLEALVRYDTLAAMCGMQRSWEEAVKDFLGGELSQLLPVQLACMPCFQTGSWEAAVAK